MEFRAAQLRLFRFLIMGLVGAPLLTIAADAPSPPRVAALQELGTAMKNVNDELKSSAPQIYIIQVSARQINKAAQAQYGWFPADTAPQPGLKTAAKTDIWEHPAEFKAAQDGFATQATAFMQIAATGDVEKIRLQAKQLSQACSNCHKQFRREDKH